MISVVSTGRSVSEICEIGEQGVSFAGSDLLVHYGKHFYAAFESSTVNDELPTAKVVADHE
jgi:hypothetical protein